MKTPLLKSLHTQVFLAIIFGVALGHFYPALGESMKPLGDGFIKLIKMIIAPIIFCTIVTGIAGMDDIKKVGRVGAKALIYFEVVTTFALVMGLSLVNWLKPGAGMNVDVSKLDTNAISAYTTAAKAQSTVDFFMNIIPTSVVDAFAKGDILQVLLFSILFGWALLIMGKKGAPVFSLISDISHSFFVIVDIIMKIAPIGVFGAMAFTIGKYGIASLGPLAKLLGCFYGTCALFIFLVLGTISRWANVNILNFLSYIKEELLIVLGTSSSESVLPRIMEKLEKLGCPKSIVGLVVPTGYSFNLDGTSIYLTMAAIFVAQATNTDLTLMQELTILAVLLLTSKGASGVTGSGFIVLAATLSVIPGIPVAGLAIIFGIDRFMSLGRAITNLVGNGIATIVVSKWENELDTVKLHQTLSQSLATDQKSINNYSN
ncbi:dicarboxylate/amino acid:cation symporter [Sporomusa sp.]|jgi:aerobic C4-dicarboxylate transport protein|uniref:dicarboxylate/amino acid:cation symporter n=1 Tax=Sporomusa sp. TaxID=2078658 RepID=UPI002C1D4E2E|nr:dicarboxylate/amino acid:cation symporter [Sporomusa sp.]HWR08671.1 dicarboxylate/amino acid:cation symporter [Sporomusa sp.]